MAGFNKELALKSVPAGMKRRIFVSAISTAVSTQHKQRKETPAFPQMFAQPVIGQAANAVMEGFMNCSHARYCEEQTDNKSMQAGIHAFRKTEPCLEQFLCSLIV